MNANLVLVDPAQLKNTTQIPCRVMTPIEYILSKEKLHFNVLNLSSEMSYQGIGYYASLLAIARGDKVYPTPKIIQDLTDKKMQKMYSEELFHLFQKKLKKIQSDVFDLSIYLGKNLSSHYDRPAWELFRLIPAPLMRLQLKKQKHWQIHHIKLLTLEDLPQNHLEFFFARLKEYLEQKKTTRKSSGGVSFDIGILYDETEASPPSNMRALKKFCDAALDLGMRAELIQYKERPNILEYDGLFIREMTNVSHYTYRLARRAEKEGLVVIDDPDSIVRCTNKIYLEQLMEANNIKRPKSLIVDPAGLAAKKPAEFQFPCIVKIPDSAFCLGVFKATSYSELIEICSNVFKSSQLVLIQEFIPTEFDWRIGLLGGEPLFACRYHMPKGHWQVIKHPTKSSPKSEFGINETIPLAQVPPKVLQVAKKVTKKIGLGLYGVDLKEKDREVYVIEVNDNPNIEAGLEDLVLKDELYLQVMRYFYSECAKKRNLIQTNELKTTRIYREPPSLSL